MQASPFYCPAQDQYQKAHIRPTLSICQMSLLKADHHFPVKADNIFRFLLFRNDTMAIYVYT